MSAIEMFGWIGLLIVAILAVALDATSRPMPPDSDYIPPEDRAAALKARRDAAVKYMKANGIKSLLEGRPGWRRINPMAEAPLAKVMSIRKARR